jgi:integrase
MRIQSSRTSDTRPVSRWCAPSTAITARGYLDTRPLHHCALLVARWSGARRTEISKLHLDCLDAYPDGTPRLRLAAGKSPKERSVPIHPEAAEAVETLNAIRKQQRDLGVYNPELGRSVRRLFLRHGRLASNDYLL